ncbi:MAG: chromate transporter [Thermoflexia bacterium]|nr:MAG: chromate transporter [Thermoflexia bacterium]
MDRWLQILWLFLKINLLTTSGPASASLLYKEAVGHLMTEEEFVEAVGFSSVLPGSDALQLAMFVGYALGGIPGALVALLGSILPPTVLMLLVVSLLQRIRGEAWVSNFVQGLAPAVAVLMVLVAWRIFGEDARNWKAILLALASFIAFQLKVPPALVLLAAGLLGIWLFR